MTGRGAEAVARWEQSAWVYGEIGVRRAVVGVSIRTMVMEMREEKGGGIADRRTWIWLG